MPGIPAASRLAAALGVPAERFAEGTEDPADDEPAAPPEKRRRAPEGNATQSEGGEPCRPPRRSKGQAGAALVVRFLLDLGAAGRDDLLPAPGQLSGAVRRRKPEEFMSGGAAAAAIVKAIKASGVIVRVEPDDFLGILRRQPGALGVHATGGFFSTNCRYLTS
jgi:hypothetical protein